VNLRSNRSPVADLEVKGERAQFWSARYHIIERSSSIPAVMERKRDLVEVSLLRGELPYATQGRGEGREKEVDPRGGGGLSLTIHTSLLGTSGTGFYRCPEVSGVPGKKFWEEKLAEGGEPKAVVFSGPPYPTRRGDRSGGEMALVVLGSRWQTNERIGERLGGCLSLGPALPSYCFALVPWRFWRALLI